MLQINLYIQMRSNQEGYLNIDLRQVDEIGQVCSCTASQAYGSCL